MSWEARLLTSIEKRLRRFPTNDRERILEALRDFVIDSWRGDIVKIGGYENLWRRCVGNYRIFYSALSTERSVKIKALQRHTSGTY